MLSNKRKEKISAFLDNDMHRDELMSFSLSAEADDAEVARHYQMVGDALRGEMSDSSFVDISAAVRDAVASEPLYEMDTAAVGASSIETSATSDEATVKTAAKSGGLFDLSTWFRPVAGMAIAASVAVVMVVTLSSEQGADGYTPPLAVNKIVQPAGNQAVLVASERNTKEHDTKLQNADFHPGVQVNQQLDPQLVNRHLEFATQDALQGRMPLVRSVSYEAEK